MICLTVASKVSIAVIKHTVSQFWEERVCFTTQLICPSLRTQGWQPRGGHWSRGKERGCVFSHSCHSSWIPQFAFLDNPGPPIHERHHSQWSSLPPINHQSRNILPTIPPTSCSYFSQLRFFSSQMTLASVKLA